MSPKDRRAAKILQDSLLIDDQAIGHVINAKGYQWATVQKDDRPAVRALVPIEFAQSEELRIEASMYNGVLMKFADLQQTEADFLEFANEFGPLGLRERIEILLFPEGRKAEAETWGAWTDAHNQIRTALRFASAVRQSTGDQWVREIKGQWVAFDPEDDKRIGRRRCSVTNERHAAEKLSAWTINDGLLGHTGVLLLSQKRGGYALRGVPTTLLGRMWWQLARLLCGEANYSKCKVCGAPLEIGEDGFMTTKEFCSAACRQKDHRNKVKEAKRLRDNGLSINKIAKQLSTTPAAIQHWLTKTK